MNFGRLVASTAAVVASVLGACAPPPPSSCCGEATADTSRGSPGEAAGQGALVHPSPAMARSAQFDDPVVVGADTAQLVSVDPTHGVCWRKTEMRGAGTPATCAAGEELHGGVCYMACKTGETAVGATCWERCPDGYTDEKGMCQRAASTINADTSKCPVTDLCGVSSARGCTLCPAGYRNNGCTCRMDANAMAKRSYGRGIGKPPGCGADQSLEGGLCYPACRADYAARGPVCWAGCSGEAPVACGAGCAVSEAACTAATTKQLVKSLEGVTAAIAATPPGRVLAYVQSLNAFNLPPCGL